MESQVPAYHCPFLAEMAMSVVTDEECMRLHLKDQSQKGICLVGLKQLNRKDPEDRKEKAFKGSAALSRFAI
jgi:hypothetical protein